jgi:hypothetical protein
MESKTGKATGYLRYARPVGLLACPFCREMFEDGEARSCPVCGMALTPFDKLPPSHDALHDEAGVPAMPEREPLAWYDLRRGKGATVLFGCVGLGLFFLPWVHLTLPYIASKSGFDLAHERIGWLWACCAAWFVLVPTVASRRSIAQLRGARVAAAFLAAIPGVAVTVLLARPPRSGLVTLRYTWEWPIYAVLALSLVAIAVAVRLGGRVDDIAVRKGTSKGQVVH